MAWKKEVFGTLPDGRQADKYTLTNKNGVSAAFTSLGGIWLGMIVPDRNGQMEDVVLGFDSVEKCLSLSGHLGEIVGRNANRIGNGAFTLNGVTYKLAINSAGRNNLHSGPDFYRNRIWDVELKESGDGTAIEFSLFSPDGDQGYPGNARIRVSYTLTEDNSLRLDYHMVSDKDTIANMTNHVYFNLAGHGAGHIGEQVVWIDADAYTPGDETSVPTGEVASVKGTPLDFTQAKAIGRDIDADFGQLNIAGGYDHNWVLNHPAGKLSLSAKIYDPGTGRRMEVWTDLPGVQFYTANGLKECQGKDGAVYQRRGAYCFETQYFPDAVNKPQFASPVLREGEEYKTTTIYRFTVE
ncbi:MAG: galactose mutarotase [Lachnospiraceae bacterium]|nr:galactose mutarotase [Lachnospiraceae bacterium]